MASEAQKMRLCEFRNLGVPMRRTWMRWRLAQESVWRHWQRCEPSVRGGISIPLSMTVWLPSKINVWLRPERSRCRRRSPASSNNAYLLLLNIPKKEINKGSSSFAPLHYSKAKSRFNKDLDLTNFLPLTEKFVKLRFDCSKFRYLKTLNILNNGWSFCDLSGDFFLHWTKYIQ